MSLKAPETNGFFTPSTCFAVACLAFSLVAISTIWTNTKDTNSTAPRKQRQSQHGIELPQAHADNARGEAEQHSRVTTHERQSRIASAIALSVRVIHRMQSHDQDEIVVDLVRELSLFVSALCQLQQQLFANPNSLVQSPHLAGCFDTTMYSLDAVLSPLGARLASGDHQSVALSNVIKHINNQKSILELLLAGLQATNISHTTSTDSAVSKLQPDMGTKVDAPSMISLDHHEKPWNEPPPQYSPSAASSSVFSEKSKAAFEAPVTDSASQEVERSPMGCEAVYAAVTRNDSRALTDLLASGTECTARFGDLQRTPLHQAAHLNRHDCLISLLRYGAEMTTEDAKGDTALHLAAWAGNVEALTALLAHGADVNWISGRDGYSPLWCAVSAYQIDAARLLLRNGARVSLRSVSGAGLTVLHQAAVTNQGAMCELLLDRGAQPDSIDDEKSTPLHYAAASGCVASAKALLHGGADLEARQVHGLSPVLWAAHKGHADVLGLLLDSGGRLECKTEGGATALHLAANRGHINAACLLLERGASCQASASWDDVVGTPIEMAVVKGHSRLAKILAGKLSK